MKIYTTLALLVMMSMLSGCIFFVGAAAGGAAGYCVSHDNDCKPK